LKKGRKKGGKKGKNGKEVERAFFFFNPAEKLSVCVDLEDCEFVADRDHRTIVGHSSLFVPNATLCLPIASVYQILILNEGFT
jgi:hypothetical protein